MKIRNPKIKDIPHNSMTIPMSHDMYWTWGQKTMLALFTAAAAAGCSETVS